MTSTDNTAKRTQDRIGRATGIEVRVQGDNVGQLESAAIDRAQQFFGPALSLQVEGGYTAHEQLPAFTQKGAFYADIRVVAHQD